MSESEVLVVRKKRGARSASGGEAKVGRSSPKSGSSSKMKGRRSYGVAVRRRVVQLYLEEGISAALVAKETGVSQKAVYVWARRYRECGEAGLEDAKRGERVGKTSQPVKEKIEELKRSEPQSGVKRISQMLKRLFCLQASPETVRRHLKKAGLATPKVKARKKPEEPERRFEASTPNQMWQSDITYYPIQGKMAYIVGFIDDNSRYITSLGVYRSQTSDNVVETYRLGVGEFGAPKEMLTDNGRQYASWRGRTKFQKELHKDHVHHIRSTPHHPMTLGKIERFWKSLKDEFLSRARFETFEEAKERVAYWVKYYNHKRTHQGLDGMTPADRFFKIHTDLKAAIERGVAANVEEIALRGKPVEPFYMVGRVGDKSVVIETDKKRVSVLVDGEEVRSGQAMIYDIKARTENEADKRSGRENEASAEGVQCEGKESGGTGSVEREAQCGNNDEGVGSAVGRAELLGEAGAQWHADGSGSYVAAAGERVAEAPESAGAANGKDVETGCGTGSGCRVLNEKESDNERNGTGQVRGSGEVPVGVECVDGTEEGVSALPGTGDQLVAVLSVAGPGVIGYVAGTGITGPTGRCGRAGVANAGQAAVGPQGAVDRTAERGAECALAQPADEEQGRTGDAPVVDRFLTEEVKRFDRRGSESGEADAGDRGSPCRTDNGDAGGPGTRSESQDVLRVVGARQGSDVSIADGSADRPATGYGGRGEGASQGSPESHGEGADRYGGSAQDPSGDPGNARRSGLQVTVA